MIARPTSQGTVQRGLFTGDGHGPGQPVKSFAVPTSYTARMGRVCLWLAFRRTHLITPYYEIKNGRKDLAEVPFFSYIICVDAKRFSGIGTAIKSKDAAPMPEKNPAQNYLYSPATFSKDAPPLSIRSALSIPRRTGHPATCEQTRITRQPGNAGALSRESLKEILWLFFGRNKKSGKGVVRMTG